MIVDKELLDSLTAAAKESPRRRMHFDLRDSAEDGSMRMLNAIEPETEIPIHRHTMTSEDVMCIRGHVREVVYKEVAGMLVEAYSCEMTDKSPVPFIHVPMGAWHTCKSLKSGSVILEFKNTKYNPETSEELWNG